MNAPYLDKEGAILFDPTPYEVKGDAKDFRHFLILAPGEHIITHMDGSKKRPHMLVQFLFTFLSLGIWLFLRYNPLVTMILTDHGRVITFERVIRFGLIQTRKQDSYFLDHLMYGHMFFSNPTAVGHKCLCAPYAVDVHVGRLTPFVIYRLEFFNFPQLAEASYHRDKDNEDEVEKQEQKKLKNLLLGSNFGGSLEIELDYDDIDAALAMAGKFTASLMYHINNKNKIVSVLDEGEEKGFSLVDHDQDANSTPIDNKSILVDKKLLGFGKDERLIDVIDCYRANDVNNWWWKRLTLGLAAIISWIFIGNTEEAFCISDRRLVAFTHTSRFGKPVDVERRQTIQFWIVRDISAGKLVLTRQCCSRKEVSTLQIKMRPGGILRLHPVRHNSNERVREFMENVITVQSPPLLGIFRSSDLSLLGESKNDIILMEKERILAALRVERPRGSCLRVACIGCFTCCTRPHRQHGFLVVTTHRLIEAATVTNPLMRAASKTVENFWFLPALRRSAFEASRRCRLLPCECGENIMVGIDIKDVINDDVTIQFSFKKSSQVESYNARYMMALLALSQMTYEERCHYEEHGEIDWNLVLHSRLDDNQKIDQNLARKFSRMESKAPVPSKR